MVVIFQFVWNTWMLGKHYRGKFDGNLLYSDSLYSSLDKIYKKNGPFPLDVLKKIGYAVREYDLYRLHGARFSCISQTFV